MAWTTWVCTSGGRSRALDGRSSPRAALICSIVSIFVSGAPTSPLRAPCSIARGCVAWIRDAGAMTPTRPGLGHADVVRASQLQHAVEHVDCHVHLSGPTLLRVRAQLIPDHALVPAD